VQSAWPAAVTVKLDTDDEATAFNLALPLCRGGFLWRLDPAARLAPDAIFYAASAIAAAPGLNAIFSDHDSVGRDGARSAPMFWTGWDPDAACASPGLMPPMLLRTEAVRAAGGLRPGPCAPAALAWRVIGAAPARVHHIQRPLFSLAADASWLGGHRARRAAARGTQAWRRLLAEQVAPARVEAVGGLLRVILDHHPYPRPLRPAARLHRRAATTHGLPAVRDHRDRP
jgi:hypothetical protein